MEQRPQYQTKKRLTVLFVFLLVAIVLLLVRLVWIQLVNSEEYQSKALEQRLRMIDVEPKRGDIYDRNGKKLAVSTSIDTVVGIPREVENPEEVARRLSGVLDYDYDTIYDRLTRSASAVYIARKIDESKAREIRRMDLPGIVFTEESSRFYPAENLASHVLGFAGIDSQGLEGVERSYDRQLRGSPGKISRERDASGRSIPEGIRDYIPPEDGNDIHLTIDETVQYIAERELEKAREEFDISGGTIIVLDPRDGGLLALANKPDYNPNIFTQYEQKNWRNRAISDSFEPGSTFKIVTTASALEEGAVSENDILVDPGHIEVSGSRIDCWKSGGHGRQTFAEVVQNSCNPGFVQVGMRLGKESFYNYINSFGFGRETNINLPGETQGLVSAYDDIGPVELATLSFGHGITATPIQLASAVGAVANDGMLLQPRLVDKVTDDKGKVVEEKEAVPVRKVVSTETAQKTRDLLKNVVADGTGQSAALEGYQVGGKTGTAQHYGEQVYDSSFVGMVPINEPELVVLVVLYDVTGFPYYGSQTAAPVFKNVALDTLRYLEIPPQKKKDLIDDDPSQVEIPEVTGVEVIEAENRLKNAGLDVTVIGEGNNVEKQVPSAGARVNEKSTVLLFTENGLDQDEKYYIPVPDLEGMQASEASEFLKALGLEPEFSGEGMVVEQEIDPGTRVPGGTEIRFSVEDDDRAS
ncbi:MAG: penicillin-binding transpeptidase domain-containing protein [Halanaerobiaceae bacterium]